MRARMSRSWVANQMNVEGDYGVFPHHLEVPVHVVFKAGTSQQVKNLKAGQAYDILFAATVQPRKCIVEAAVNPALAEVMVGTSYWVITPVDEPQRLQLACVCTKDYNIDDLGYGVQVLADATSYGRWR